VRNQSGLLGLRLGETTIFGRPFHGQIERGFSFDREPAKECHGRIYDKATGDFIAPLWWRRAGTALGWQQGVTIESGESCELGLFARLSSEPTKYFVFEPIAGEPGSPPRVPATDEAKFEGTHDFRIEVAYSYERQKLVFEGRMRKGYDGRLYWESRGGGGSF
jgi:hypothetical protein